MTSASGASDASGARRWHRPTYLGPAALDAFTGDTDPALRIEAAHATAAALVEHGRRETEQSDAETARLVALTDDHGLDDVAELWSDRPGDTLPGALWRLYALRAGIRQDSEGMAAAFDEGRRRAPVHEAVAGVAEPPGPQEVRQLADAVLAGAFSGDLAVALERAGAFCRVVATGWALMADQDVEHRAAHRLTRRAADLARTGAELSGAAELWRHGALS